MLFDNHVSGEREAAAGDTSVERLLAIIRTLRDPQKGCPWDKVQTHTSIRMNFLEEAYEAVDAIDLDDPHLLCEELGDVLMQVAFHTVMEEERGRFTWQQVCDGVCDKLVLRHPHIFGGQSGINDWDTIKNKEKGRVTLQDDLESVPHALPALMRAAKLQKRAARAGVTVALPDDLPESFVPEASTEAQTLIGEELFRVVALAARLGVDPEQALQKKNAAFTRQAAEEQPKSSQSKSR